MQLLHILTYFYSGLYFEHILILIFQLNPSSHSEVSRSQLLQYDHLLLAFLCPLISINKNRYNLDIDILSLNFTQKVGLLNRRFQLHL